MAKVVYADISALGFTKEMFRKTSESDFQTFVGGIITEQAAILSGRIGSTTYAVATSPTAEYVTRAEKCLVAAELVQRRINVILGNVTGAGQEINVTHEGAQKKVYRDEAEYWIARLGSEDFATGCLETSHFEEDDEA